MPVAPRASLYGSILEAKEAQARMWEPHDDLKRFLADHYPEEWQKVQACGQSHRTYKPAGSEGEIIKHIPRSCHRLPFCIACVKRAEWRRLREAQDALSMCTPAGKPLRAIGIVMAAPVTNEGDGWGMKASHDVPLFGKVVWRTLQRLYGQGIGAILSYQDFGERAFAKRHPHMDLTLNGWMLDADGQAVHTPRIELVDGGLDRVGQIIGEEAQVFELGADRHFTAGHWMEAKEGMAEYARIMAYKMRELVDLRKVEYSRSQGKVWWRSYKREAPQEFTVREFKAGLAEYRQRLGQWGAKPRVNLHRRYGHMADRAIHATRRLMGGALLPHVSGCSCASCGDWEQTWLPEGEGANARLVPPG